MSSVHAYRARCSWSGSTGEGYEQYRREHAGSAPPAGDSLLLSADPAFRGLLSTSIPSSWWLALRTHLVVLSRAGRVGGPGWW